MGRLLVGTSGFSYPDWRGPFYPENLPKAAMLSYYANFFSQVELDFTYYQMPGKRSIEGLERKTPKDFLFCVKAHKSMTHEFFRDRARDRENFRYFVEALEPFLLNGKLGCILTQFPWGFKYNSANLEYLEFVREELVGLPVVVEFRNIEWLRKEVFYLLHEKEFGYCCVDEPKLKGLLPPLALATSNLGYVRFHGRNAAKWWRPDEPGERYNYLYSREELLEWAPRIRKLVGKTESTFVLMNNCHAGHAVINARMLQEILSEE